MSKEKRGGARLEKSTPPKKTAPDNSDQPAVDETAPTKKTLSKGAKIAIIVVAAVLALLIGLFAIYKSWARLPTVPDLPDIPSPTVDPFTGDTTVVKPVDSNRKENFYTFLVVGRDTGGGGNTDTIMLASYDLSNQKLSVMSIPRDTMVNARHPGKNRKINGVWNLGLYYAEKGSEKKGIDYLREAVGDLTGIVPDFYVIVNWSAFGRLVDAIGGVYFEVPFDMKYKDPTQDLIIDQAAGYRRLSGQDAMEVVRWRHDNSYSKQYRDGDLGRVRTQQALMKAIIAQCLQIKNVTKITEFAEIFTEEVETNLSVGNLVAFAERAITGGLKMENVTFTTAPIEGVYVKGASYVQVKPEEFLGILNADFNPYIDSLEMENLNILQYSASKGYYSYQGTGTGTPPEPTKTSTATAKPSKTSEASSTAKPTKASTSTAKPTKASTSTKKPSKAPTATAKPTKAPTKAPAPTASRKPSATPKPTQNSSAASSPSPTKQREPVSSTPQPTPEQTAAPTPTPTPAPTPEPTPAPTPEPAPTATPKPTPEPTVDPNELGIPTE